jgi:hypothetical protein
VIIGTAGAFGFIGGGAGLTTMTDFVIAGFRTGLAVFRAGFFFTAVFLAGLRVDFLTGLRAIFLVFFAFNFLVFFGMESSFLTGFVG